MASLRRCSTFRAACSRTFAAHSARRNREDALTAAVRANVEFASSNPAAARFLMKEALAGGPPALDARDAGIGEIAKSVEKALGSLGGDEEAPDVPAAAVIGAVQRVLASRLRRGERALGDLQGTASVDRKLQLHR